MSDDDHAFVAGLKNAFQLIYGSDGVQPTHLLCPRHKYKNMMKKLGLITLEGTLREHMELNISVLCSSRQKVKVEHAIDNIIQIGNQFLNMFKRIFFQIFINFVLHTLGQH